MEISMTTQRLNMLNLGTFNTEDEAFTAYVKAKKEVIMETAQKAINEGLIDERIYNALLKYEIKEY